MSNTERIRKTALERLKKCWAEAVMISIIEAGLIAWLYMLILIYAKILGIHTANTILPRFDSLPPVFVIPAAILIIAAYIFNAPLTLGVRWFYWQSAEEGRDIKPLSSLFACYTSPDTLKKCIKLRLSAVFRQMPSAVLCFAISSLVIIISASAVRASGYNKLTMLLLSALCGFTIMVSSALFVLMNMKSIPIGFIMADDPYATPRQILEKNKLIMKGKYKTLASIYMYYFRYLPLSLLILPMLVTRSVMYMATAVFMHECIDEYNRANGGGSKDDLTENRQ